MSEIGAEEEERTGLLAEVDRRVVPGSLKRLVEAGDDHPVAEGGRVSSATARKREGAGEDDRRARRQRARPRRKGADAPRVDDKDGSTHVGHVARLAEHDERLPVVRERKSRVCRRRQESALDPQTAET